jgi:hypothetical protein
MELGDACKKLSGADIDYGSEISLRYKKNAFCLQSPL